jgi:predicted transposase YdaD
MFSLSDIKQTRVYQEALEEGREEGREERDLEWIARMVASGFTVEQIALVSGLNISNGSSRSFVRGKRDTCVNCGC